jgi:mycothiol synthase
MVCDLSQLPAVSLPSGYALRHFEPGDAAHWDHIICHAFGWDAAERHFERVMATDVAYDPRRVLFITHRDQPVATAAAWWRASHPPTLGYLHYVGALASHSGRGLGLQVSLACMHFMRDEGRTRCLLHTDDFRLPALRTYLKLKFAPVLVHENQRQRWRDVFDALGQSRWLDDFAGVLAGRVVMEGSAAWA